MNNVNHALVLRIGELLELKKITRYKLAMNKIGRASCRERV